MQKKIVKMGQKMVQMNTKKSSNEHKKVQMNTKIVQIDQKKSSNRSIKIVQMDKKNYV